MTSLPRATSKAVQIGAGGKERHGRNRFALAPPGSVAELGLGVLGRRLLFGPCGRHGNAAVEFALIAPVLMLFMLGIVEFGRAMWVQSDLEFAVEETARSGYATGASSSALSALAQSKISAVPSAAVTVTTTVSGSLASVTASYPFSFVVPNLLPFGPITLSATSSFVK